MKKIDASKTIGIVANLGVLAGILLLAYEIHQNQRMVRAQTRDSVAQSLATILHDEALSPNMQEVAVRAFGGESLTPVEQAQFNLSWAAKFRLWENMHYQYRQGLFSEAELAAEQESWKRLFASDAIRDFWCSRRSEWSEDFRSAVEATFSGSQCQ